MIFSVFLFDNNYAIHLCLCSFSLSPMPWTACGFGLARAALGSGPYASLEMTEPNTGNDNTRRRKKKDNKQCRICLGGSEEVEELGALLRPCKCKGSIRYTHVKCLNTWRNTGTVGNSNFWQCAQCGYKYNIARTRILGLSNSPWVLAPTTIALFLAIVFAASFIVSFFIPELDDPLLLVPPPSPYDTDPLSMSIGGLTWHTPLSIASDVIRETVHAFAEVSTPREVLLEARRRESLRTVEDTTVWGRFKKRIPFKNVGRPEPKEKAKPVAQRIDPRTAYSPSDDGPRITLWSRLLRKFMLGLSLVGILSFLNLLITMSLFGPLQIARARWIRGGRREAGGGRDIGTILIIIFVLIGVARALYGVYTMTQALAQYILQKAENAILEVQDGDDSDEEEEEEESEANEDTPRSPADKPVVDAADDPAMTTATETVENKATRRPRPPRLNNARARDWSDDFGEELPDTPGGWKEEWDIAG